MVRQISTDVKCDELVSQRGRGKWTAVAGSCRHRHPRQFGGCTHGLIVGRLSFFAGDLLVVKNSITISGDGTVNASRRRSMSELVNGEKGLDPVLI